MKLPTWAVGTLIFGSIVAVAVVLGLILGRGPAPDSSVEARIAAAVKQHADSISASFDRERKAFEAWRVQSDSVNRALADSLTGVQARRFAVERNASAAYFDAQEQAFGVGVLGGGPADVKGVGDAIDALRAAQDSVTANLRRQNALLVEQLDRANQTIQRLDSLMARQDSVLAARERQADAAQAALDAAITELHAVKRSRTAWQIGSGAAVVATAFAGWQLKCLAMGDSC